MSYKYTLTTPVGIPDYPFRFGYSDKVLCIGSCFATEMADRMQRARLDVMANPVGIIYNPLSIAWALEQLLEGYHFGMRDLFFDGELYHSWGHHGAFSGPKAEDVLRGINQEIRSGREYLLSAKLLVLTFGTAHYYRLKSSGQVVANCHKQPGQLFDRQLMDLEEMYLRYTELFIRMHQENPALQIILTVSPVRYIRDGLIESFRSKSLLNVLAHRLASMQEVHYFPAYEILTDELRDYRFYARDRVHPSEEASDIIWEYFKGALLSGEARSLEKRIIKVLNQLNHRPLHPGTPRHRAFLAKLEEEVAALKKECGIDLGERTP